MRRWTIRERQSRRRSSSCGRHFDPLPRFVAREIRGVCHAHGFAWAWGRRRPCPRKAVGMAPNDHYFGGKEIMTFRRSSERSRRWRKWIEKHRDTLVAIGLPDFL